jgi:UDP-GlcNAc:undecaprenyl-phosphate GlcNAc-1-phosphate transferase
VTPVETGGLPSAALARAALLSFGVAFALCLALTPLVRALARRRGLVDRPDGARKSHAAPVPRLGGVAVYVSFMAALGLCLVLTRDAPDHAAVLRDLLALALASTVILLLGVADDLRGIAPWTKIGVQAAAALYLYGSGYRIALLSNPFGEPVVLGALSLPLTLLWLAGLSNALNLIDGLDGLAAGVGLFATSAVFIAALLNGRWEVGLLAAALAGALFAFLRYNFSPATIFLGDSGSLFIGFVLAALAVRGSMKSSTAIALFVPLLALGLPILDTSIAMVRRLIGGRRLFEPDAEHIHHRMLRLGLAPRRVVVILYAVAAFFGALSLLTVEGNAQVVGVVMVVFSAVAWVGIHRLGYVELVEAARSHALSASVAVKADPRLLEGLSIRLRQARDADELWAALAAGGERLGLSRLEFRCEEGAEAGRRLERQWLSPRRSTSSSALWSYGLPISVEGRTLGRLIIEGRLEEGADPDRGRVPLALVEELAAALRRLLAPPPAQGRVGPALAGGRSRQV